MRAGLDIGGDAMGFFRVLKRVMTGEVIETIEAPANDGKTTMSLRLKRDGSGRHYVVLVSVSSGNYQYVAFDRDEFDQFARAIETMRNVLNQQP